MNWPPGRLYCLYLEAQRDRRRINACAWVVSDARSDAFERGHGALLGLAGDVVPTASGPQNRSVKSSSGHTSQVPGTAARPPPAWAASTFRPGCAAKITPGAGRALGAGRPIGRPSGRVRTRRHGRWHVRAGNATPVSSSPGNLDLVPSRGSRCIAGAPHWGVRHGWPLGRTRMRCQGPARDGDG
jgi:hypothetical protein